MELVLEPEPEPDQRAAVALALERLLTQDTLPAPYRSAWRAAGIAENVADESAAGAYATALPRSSPDATRA
jgi:hypothetical protein